MSSSRQFASSAAATTTPVSKSSAANTKSIKEGVFSNASLLKIISTSRGGVASILISDESMITTPTSTLVASPSTLTETLFAPLELPKQSKSSKKAPPEEVLGKTVVFQSNDVILEGMIIALRYPVAFVYFSEESSKQQNLSTLLTKDNSVVKVLHSSTQTKLPTSNQGMVDCYGNNLLETTTTSSTTSEPLLVDIFAPIPQVSEIQLINTPLVTGITMVDALAPIGRGQNMLLVGEEGTGRRNIANTAIQTQLSLGADGALCFYACTTPTSVSPKENVTLISTKKTKINNEETEEEAVVRAAESIAIASSACSMAEYWARNHGKDTLVVIDTIDNHKAFWDYTTKALVDVYGLDSVVQEDLNGSASSEMRGFFSNLIQRSGRYNAQQGGGSVTLLVLVTIPTAKEDDQEGGTSFHLNDFEGFHPKIQSRIHLLIQQKIRITPTVLNKLGITIPPRTVEEHKRTNSLRHVDDLISMTDGQIWLSTNMLPMKPLVDPQKSITRVGIGADTDCRADAPALRNLVGGLRFELAQASSLEGATDVASQKQLLRKDSMLLAMYQEDDTKRMLWEECTCLLAARMGVLDASIQAGRGVGTTEGKELLKQLLANVQNTVAPDILREINETFELNLVAKKALESSIQSFFI